MKCLEHPAYLGVDPTERTLLVSEPRNNRIGVYDAGSLAFKGWFSVRGHSLVAPRNIEYLGEFLHKIPI